MIPAEREVPEPSFVRCLLQEYPPPILQLVADRESETAVLKQQLWSVCSLEHTIIMNFIVELHFIMILFMTSEIIHFNM